MGLFPLKRRPRRLNRTMERHFIAAGLDLDHAAEMAGTKPKDGSAIPARDLDLDTNLTVKCIKGRERHLWRRVGSFKSLYWMCTYCYIPCQRSYQHEGVFDPNAAWVCDEIPAEPFEPPARAKGGE